MRKLTLLLLLYLTCLLLPACAGPDAAPEPEETAAAPEEPALSYASSRQDADGDQFAEFEMTVPQEIYDAFAPEAALAVSHDLLAFAEAESGRWQEDQAALRQQDPDLEAEFTVDLTLFYRDEEIVSLTGSGYSYSSGAAHPQVYAYGFVYDADSGRRITMEQLLGEGWQEELFPAVCEQAAASGAGYYQDLDTLLPLVFREEGWYADKDSVYLVFNAAEIAPYAAGTPCFRLPR